MRLSEIHTAIEAEQGPEFSADQAFATLVAIEHLAQIEGVPLSALDFAAPKFGQKYIYEFSDLRGSWGGRGQYLAWRRLILDAQMLFTPGDVDADPWRSLNRAVRIEFRKPSTALYDLSRHLSADLHPQDVTDALLTDSFNQLPEELTDQFRKGVGLFRRLFEKDLPLRTGLLPKECPKPLPRTRDHLLLTCMSPEIEEWRDTLTDRQTVYALDYLNRLAIAGGQLNGRTDILDDLRRALCHLPDPADLDIPPILRTSLRVYVNRVRRTLGGPDPRKTSVEQAWADLRAAARAVRCETSCLWAVAQTAAARGIFPTKMSESHALEMLGEYDVHHKRSKFRKGCEQLDALRGKVSPDVLPPSPLGIKPLPPRAPRPLEPVIPPDPVQAAWAGLYALLRERGWTHEQTSVLSYLRARACPKGIAPENLTQNFIDTLEQEISTVTHRTRLRAAVQSVVELSSDQEFSHLPKLAVPHDRRRSHCGLGKQAQVELEAWMDFMNAAKSTRRGFSVAVGVFVDAMEQPDITLKQVLQADMSMYDLGPHEARKKVHADKLRNLRQFIELPWTRSWRKLQKVVTGTGMSALKNPIPKVLSWHPAPYPHNLTLEWA